MTKEIAQNHYSELASAGATTEEVDAVYTCELELGDLIPSPPNTEASTTTDDYCSVLPDEDDDPTDEGDILYMEARSTSFTPRPRSSIRHSED